MLISYFISPFCTNGSFVSINQFSPNFNYFIGINLIYRKISLHIRIKIENNNNNNNKNNSMTKC